MKLAGKRWFKRMLWLVAALIVLLVVVPPLLGLLLRRFSPPRPGQTPADQLCAERIRIMTPERVIKTMNIQPGASVLDLGAGFGLFTFPLAQAVGAKGRVYASDVDPSATRYLSAQASRFGIPNVFPTLVRKRGFDRFYLQHTFDLILASDVLFALSRPESFLTDLRPSLKRDTGRLWVLNSGLDADFAALEFGDFSIVLYLFRLEGMRSPIVSRYSPNVREALASLQTDTVPEPVRELIVQDLNRMLEDPTLWPEVQRKLQPVDAHLGLGKKAARDYLSKCLEKEGGFLPGNTNFSTAARQQLRLLNRFVIVDLLKTAFWERAFAFDRVQTLREWRKLLHWTEAPYTPTTLKSAGYELIKEHKIMPYHRVWEFKRAL